MDSPCTVLERDTNGVKQKIVTNRKKDVFQNFY